MNCRVGLGVVARHAEQHGEAPADSAEDFAASDADLGAAHALNNRTHPAVIYHGSDGHRARTHRAASAGSTASIRVL